MFATLGCLGRAIREARASRIAADLLTAYTDAADQKDAVTLLSAATAVRASRG